MFKWKDIFGTKAIVALSVAGLLAAGIACGSSDDELSLIHI